jgi:hypothetical protein
MLAAPLSCPSEPLLKTDALARVRTPLAKREEILAEFDRSGLSGARFAKLHGIKYQTFMAWMRKRREVKRSVPDTLVGCPDPMGQIAARLGLREVGLGAVAEKECLEIELAGGIRMRVRGSEQALLAARIIGLLSSGEGRRAC